MWDCSVRLVSAMRPFSYHDKDACGKISLIPKNKEKKEKNKLSCRFPSPPPPPLFASYKT